ncbi:MAG: TetR/AcrR family transcriptional regulator [Candidatus Omnitrophica bacterium]|nr:TetR/AcrR family transcriptional regulator [Candidatus Omnitrophota bacterium]
MKAKDYSLREKKHARTKIAIMNAFLKHLEKNRFESIAIRQICKDSEISEGTFFNYFPQKIDIVNYYVQLAVLRAVWLAQKESAQRSCLNSINILFSKLAADIKNINIVYQLIAALATRQERPKKIAVTEVEKKLAFPDCPGIEHARAIFIDDFLKESLKGALKKGELSKGTDIDDVLISLLAILGGTLLAAKLSKIGDYKYHYNRQLKILWKGLNARPFLR